MKTKKNISKILSLVVVLTIMLSQLTVVHAIPENNNSKGISPISGTFIQPWMYSSWSDERWDQELIMLKELGIEYIVMGDVAEKTSDGKWYTFYDSKLPEVEKMHYEAMDKLFEMCAKHGIKLYLGMGVDHAWWGWDLANPSDAKAFIEAANMSVKFADELHKKYKAKYPETYYGFYSVYEIWNHGSWNDDKKRETYANALSDGFNIIIDGLNKIDPSMPLLFSPFATPSEGFASKENTKAFWIDFFKKTNLRKMDAFSPMDNVGGGGQNVDGLEEWTKNYAEAIQESGNKLQFWSNCESFIQPDDSRISGKDGINYWGACTVDRFIKQVEITSKYCDRVFNFAYPHYFSPYNNVPGYHEVYKNYLLTGKGDEVKPIPPNKIKTSETDLDGKKVIKIEWSGIWDDYGVQKVNVYKNGALMDYRISSRMDGSNNEPIVPNFVYDTNFPTVAKFVNYEFEVIDCWGNVSERSKFTIFADNKIIDANLDAPYESKYVDGKLFVSEKPSEPYPTSFESKNSSNSISEENVEEQMSQVYLVGIIIFGVLFLIGAGILIVYLVKKKKNNTN